MKGLNFINIESLMKVIPHCWPCCLLILRNAYVILSAHLEYLELLKVILRKLP